MHPQVGWSLVLISYLIYCATVGFNFCFVFQIALTEKTKKPSEFSKLLNGYVVTFAAVTAYSNIIYLIQPLPGAKHDYIC